MRQKLSKFAGSGRSYW